MFTRGSKIFRYVRKRNNRFSLRKTCFFIMDLWTRKLQLRRTCWNFSRKGWTFSSKIPQKRNNFGQNKLHTLFKKIIWRCRAQFWRSCRSVSRRSQQIAVHFPKMFWRKDSSWKKCSSPKCSSWHVECCFNILLKKFPWMLSIWPLKVEKWWQFFSKPCFPSNKFSGHVNHSFKKPAEKILLRFEIIYSSFFEIVEKS